ncbi:MAG: hypothetical protein LC098_10520 [Burkholderiales bacterium]|uniref:hypothetical protein n=1 Tax=Dokdonella sp. TaxID=2291710 RepID=UPI0027B8D17B|nr:hypothetical protein [Dokdonella sp.]MCZ2135842.1 hypothetical protein [Burkholderiales bacterium]
MMIDRVGNNLFGALRFLAVLCAAIGVVTLFTAGAELAWPWLRAALLCAVPVAAPAFFTRLVNVIAARRRQARRRTE